MNTTHESKRHDNARAIFWIGVLVALLTFLVLDVGALAWSATLISGHQLMAELFTFFVVVSGAGITVWKMKVN